MRGGFKLILIAALVGSLPAACWRSAGLGADGGETDDDTLGGITDPDTGGPWVYEWTSMGFPADDDLSGVYGFSSSDVFAVGDDGTLLRFDGAAWNGMQYPAATPVSDLAGVWGSSPWDVFAVGSDGVIVHYDGDAWTHMDSGTGANLHDVCGRSHDDVYAVGDGGALLAWNGASWTQIATGTDRNLFSAWCAPGTAVYAAGHASDAFAATVVLRYDGSVSQVAHPTADFLYALAGTASGDAFIGAERAGSAEQLQLEISRSAGGGPFEIVAIGEGLVLVDLWAVDDGELWGVGFVDETADSAILHVAALALEEPIVLAATMVLRSVWCDPDETPGTVFAVGDDGAIIHGVPTQAY